MKKNIVAIIPARAGSKRVPNKNIKLLDGKPLVVHTIEAAKKSKFLDRIIVSTDSEEIANISRKHGAEVPFMRPTEFAQDDSPMAPVIIHAIEYLEKQENYPIYAVVILHPGCPLRQARHIDEAINKFLKLDVTSLISLKKSSPPWWLFKTKGDKIELFLKDDKRDFFTRSQDFPLTYITNGAIQITKKENLLKTKKCFDLNNCSHIIMDEHSSIDIDSEHDFMIAEQLIKLRENKR